MKKKVVSIVILCAICALVICLAACSQPRQDAALTPMSEVSLDGHLLTWQAVEGATHYSLRVCYDDHNGFEVPVDGTSYVLKLYREGTYTLYVRPAFSSGYGAYSDAIRYVVQTESTITPVDDGDVILRGAGTYEDPLLIYTKEELASLSNGKREVQENGETTKVQNYYRLMQDIDLAGEEWQSIGASSDAFEGIFDGNGHTIRGMTQTKLNGTSLKRNGLFGTLGKATVVNLTLADVDIEIGLVSDEFRIGGLAGYSAGATVENCSVSGLIKVDSAQSTTRKGYVGMLLGYSNGTKIRRVRTEGKVDVTYAGVYAGGVVGICTAASQDNLDNVLSLVDVRAYGTGRSGSAAAGRAYAAGIAYLSGIENVSHCVWLGKASCEVVVGTPADEEMYATGMFVTGGSHVFHGQCQITLTDCFFAIEGIDYDQETYSAERYATTQARLAAIADRYAVGNAQSQKRTSAIFAVYAGNMGDPAAYSWQEGGTTVGLDLDEVWQMQEGQLSLRPYHSEWYEVRFVLDDGTVVASQRVLKGQTATSPVYTGEEGYAVRWDYNDAAPVVQDLVVRVLHTQN